MDPADQIESEIGRHWYRTAGRWADEPIGVCPSCDLKPFIVEETKRYDCVIDPSDIRGMRHSRYNTGMTWRQFLLDGGRIATKLCQLATDPEYYDDEQALAEERDPWTLKAFGGDLYIDEGNHRSVITKFRAHEEGRIRQKVRLVTTCVVSDAALRDYKQLQSELHKHDTIIDIDREPIEIDGPTKRFTTILDLHLAGLGTYRVQLPAALHLVRSRSWLRTTLPGRIWAGYREFFR